MNSFKITGTSSKTTPTWVTSDNKDSNNLEFYVTIDGQEEYTDQLDSEELFSNIKVENGKSVSVKVVAAVTADDEDLYTSP